MAIEWRKRERRPYTLQEIESFENTNSLNLPAELRDAYQIGADAEAWRDGVHCIATSNQDGSETTLFYSLEPFKSAADIEYYRAEFSQKYGVDLSGMIPFGNNGDLFVCLDYSKNPNAPEVWSLYMDEPEGSDDGYYKVADSFAEFLDALVSEDQLAAI